MVAGITLNQHTADMYCADAFAGQLAVVENYDDLKNVSDLLSSVETQWPDGTYPPWIESFVEIWINGRTNASVNQFQFDRDNIANEGTLYARFCCIMLHFETTRVGEGGGKNISNIGEN